MRDPTPMLRLLLATASATVAFGPLAQAQPSPSPSTQAGTADAIRVLLDQAAYLRSKNQTRKSDEALNRVLSLDPRNADALALKAQAAAEAGDAASAQAMLGRLVLVRPDDPRIESVRQAMLMGPVDKVALADARRAASEGRAEDAVAAYRRVFRGETAPPGLAVEYYRALGATQGSWQAARDALSAQLRANPQDLKAQIAFAELLTYRDSTRELGLERLRRLSQNRTIADQATYELRQAEQGRPAAEQATTAEPRPHSSVDEAPPAQLAAMPAVAELPPLDALAALPTAIAAFTAVQDTVPPAAASAGEPVTREYERYAQYVPQSELPQPASLPAGPALSAPPVVADPAVSPYVNPFRTAASSILTPDEPSGIGTVDQPASSAGRSSGDPLTADIDRSIQQVSNEVAPRVEASLGVRGRSGPSGLGQLFDVEAPIEASFSPNGYGRLKVVVTPVGLFAGTPSGVQRQLFGTNPLVGTGLVGGGTQSGAGAALDVGYAYGPYSADIGSTPIGLLQTNVIGGVQYAPHLSSNLVLRLTAERRAVTDSLLSYGGQRDPRTGETWGGVTRNRLYAQLEEQIGPYGVYAGVGGAGLFGRRVESNSEIEAGAGVSVPVWTTPTQEIRVGTNLIYLGYNRNLGNFTVGQGGYFSPQSFFAALFPVTYRDHVTPDLTYSVGGSIGVQTFRTKSEAVFPGQPGLQSQLEALAASGGTTIGARYGGNHVFGPAGGASGEVDYRVNDRLHIGAKAGFDRSGNFTEGTGLLYARYVFSDAN